MTIILKCINNKVKRYIGINFRCFFFYGDKYIWLLPRTNGYYYYCLFQFIKFNNTLLKLNNKNTSFFKIKSEKEYTNYVMCHKY